MSKSTSILLVCPACKSRRQVPRELVGQRVRCRQCTAELTVDPPASEDDDLLLADEPAPPPANAPPPAVVAEAAVSPTYIQSHEAAISEDDIPIAPPPASLISMAPVSKTPPSEPTKAISKPTPPIAKKAAKPALPAKVETEPAAIPPIKIDTNRRKPASTDDSSSHETWVKPPDKITLTWLFTSGIYFYFLRPVAASQWIVLASLSFIGSWLLLLASTYISAGYMAVAGGCFALGGFAFTIAAYSYGSACFVAIIENTAYHLDKADRWPDQDFVEWIFHFLRMLYLFVLTSMIAALAVGLVALIDRSLAAPAAIVTYWIFFPILLLSVLETNSPLWPVSTPILRSLFADWRVWTAFYAASALLAVASFFVILLVARQQSTLSLLLSCPLTAAVWFSYGRLIGRLASYIMHLDEREKPART